MVPDGGPDPKDAGAMSKIDLVGTCVNQHGITLRQFAVQSVLGHFTIEVPEGYEINEIIGQGAFGNVVSASSQIVRGMERVAIKKLALLREQKSDKTLLLTLRELCFLRALQHPNIIQLMFAYAGSDGAVYCVTEMLDSDLAKVLNLPGLNLSPLQIEWMAYQLVRGLAYMHGCGVMHRDLSPRNLLINEECDLKICDFGMARLEASPDEEFNEGHMSMYVCTRWYRAPELLFSLRYSFKVDVWSAGCIIIELYIKRPFLPGNSSDKQIALLIENFGLPRYIAKKIESHRVLYFLANQGLEAGNDTFKGTFPAFLDDNTYRGVIPAEASHSIRCMLHIDADMRATAEDILKSPYMGKYHNPTEEPEPKRFREADFGINQANSTAANISALIWKELEYHRGKYVDMMPELCKFSV